MNMMHKMLTRKKLIHCSDKQKKTLATAKNRKFIPLGWSLLSLRHYEIFPLWTQVFRWLCVEPEALAEFRNRSASASGSNNALICGVGKWEDLLADAIEYIAKCKLKNTKCKIIGFDDDTEMSSGVPVSLGQLYTLN